MTTHNHGLMRVLWPSDAPRDAIPGVLVGWRNSDLDVLVVGVLQGVEPRNVEYALRMRSLFRGSPYSIDKLAAHCGNQQLQVLGTLNTPSSTKNFDPKLLSLHTVPKSATPRVELYEDAAVTFQIVTFDRPDPKRMQYLSLIPISLALIDKRGTYGSVPPFDRIDMDEAAARKRRAKLVEKLKQHSVVQHPRTEKELALDTIVVQINCSAELDALMQSNISMVGVRVKRAMSVGERVVESATNFWDFVQLESKKSFRHHVWPFLRQVFVLYLMVLRVTAEVLLSLLDWRPFGQAALKDVSATAQQVDIRLQQFCYWPDQYVTLNRRRNDWESITNSHPDYIRFFNSLWLVANDVIIGIALGSYIVENVDYVAYLLDNTMTEYSVAGLQQMLTWLMDYPAGLKLNNELAKFLGDLFLWVIEYWNGCMTELRPALPYVIRIIGVTSFAGASLPISMFSDLLSLLTMHIYCFYIASARIYNWQLTIIISLFHLFRGKKRNVLRNRIDSCDYDLDQLLLGTILFTLLFFLLPTVAVFYATFAGARMAIIALKAALDTWLACLNHFPLFALMLRIKDSRRLPGGIRFELQDTPNALFSASQSSGEPVKLPPTSYVKLKSIPLPLSHTFSQYAQLGQRLRKHYLSPRVFLCLVSGQFVPPIHRKNLYSLQYSMLPVKRITVGELWQLLTADKKPQEYGHANGHPITNGHIAGGKKLNAKTKGANGYWWSK
ncbi:Putative N-acetylglucosaminyl transferase component [Septoria linicola]|uniref:N-acetylglucosaminyl transferase component n=1 Tax=Septoria linicola TaxID=215465 RepID=A0A9Q9EQV9_9PEZI|nr:putative N-acetylglucosaminyl transferase component [Septoria linicola]USW59219.1 Putative N-acetylglucosaminyl transferase component [Septoria linicola]